MKTSHYESVVIINAALEDDQVAATLSRIQETIKLNSGEITDVDDWGRKRLAYPINKSKSGYYVIYRYTAPTEAIAKIERMFRLDETVIRYLTILLDKAALDNIEYEKEARKNTAETESVNVEKEAPVEEEVVETSEDKDTEAKAEEETN